MTGLQLGGLRTAVFGTLMAFASLPASAAVLYSTGFEPPAFAPGLIAGQDGWGSFGTPAASQVEPFFAYAGVQAADVIPALNLTTQAGAFKSLTTSAPIISQSAEIYLASSSSQSEFQFSALGPGLIGFAGGFNVLANDTIQIQTAGLPIIAATFARDTWNAVDLVLNFSTQQYSIVLNGTTIASGVAFCGDNSICAGAPVAAYGNGIFDTFGGQSNNDIGFIDNYVVAAVPLPASAPMLGAALIGLGAVGFALKRRKEAAAA